MEKLVTALKAAGEPTRLRILALLGQGELTVNELVQVLDQSQPRVSRHLKLLAEAGLIERCQEGTWVFCRLADRGPNAALLLLMLDMLPAGDQATARDQVRLAEVRSARASSADAYFRANAADWNRIRSLYVPEAKVEACLLRALEGRELGDFLDIGTGTGRMLEIFASRVGHGLGIDANQDMLAIARDMLARKGIANCQARQGDLYDLPVADQSQDAVLLHQVLHYVDDGEGAIAEAARVLRPGGVLLVADFAPHGEEFLRDEQAHRRLGFTDQEVIGWGELAGLSKRSISHLDGGRLTVTIWELEKGGCRGRSRGACRKAGGSGMTPSSGQTGAIDAMNSGQPPLYELPPDEVSVSFEFFPPKTPKMEETLWDSITRLAPLSPKFVSVTYGAGGSTRERTHATIQRILKETSLAPAAHLTCVAATREEVDAVAQEYWQAGVRHIVGLRGDAPDGDGAYQPHPGGYENAEALVRGLRDIADFEISVAAYPECHPDSPNLAADLDNLKRKLDAGATRAITQFFFDTDHYFRFLDHARSFGINAPITPGILPVTNVGQLKRFAKQCGTSVPDWLGNLFEGLDDHPDTRKLVSAMVAGEMCKRLHAGGVREFHFYTLNRAGLSYAICHLLGLRPQGASEEASDG